MEQILKNLQPEKVFYYFEEICKIPHGSSNTKAISDYCAGIAKEAGLSYTQDEKDNVIIVKEATAGYEQADTLMLQGHMDMVNEKTADSTHDFAKDALELSIDGDMIRANKTTLGGDNGVAVAFMLAILTDQKIKHPRLECVFTSDEEIGLLGAAAIDLSTCKATRMINLDSEDEGIFLTSCAGGVRIDLSLPVKRVQTTMPQYKIEISNCKGGHSGAEIHHGRANASLLLGRLLFDLVNPGDLDVQVIALNGGLMDNAIPREVNAVVCCDLVDELKEYAQELFEEYKKEYGSEESEMVLSIEPVDAAETEALTPVALGKVLFLMRMVPNGVQAMSRQINGLVETSLNAGIMKTTQDEFTLSFSVRSSIDSKKHELTDRLTFLVEYLGGDASMRGDYPGWEYKEDSTLRKLMCETWQEVTGKKAEVAAIHAGLECGLFAGKLPGIDIVSMGPDMKDIHTPNEQLSISSTARCYDFLLRLMEKMK